MCEDPFPCQGRAYAKTISSAAYESIQQLQVSRGAEGVFWLWPSGTNLIRAPHCDQKSENTMKSGKSRKQSCADHKSHPHSHMVWWFLRLKLRTLNLFFFPFYFILCIFSEEHWILISIWEQTTMEGSYNFLPLQNLNALGRECSTFLWPL